MNTSVQVIPVTQLALAFIPVAMVLVILAAWSLRVWHSIYALSRMILQLVIIGYLLILIFETHSSLIVLLVLTVMLVAAGWIALGPVESKRARYLLPSILALAAGCGFTLLVMTVSVLRLTPWFEPRFVIPLAGMTLANGMNSVSLAVERFETETARGTPIMEARGIAMSTAMIPLVNSLFAVGLVTLPGMMTGQILSGVSPLVAVRYQIMVMCMMFSGSGLSAALLLFYLARREQRITDSAA